MALPPFPSLLQLPAPGPPMTFDAWLATDEGELADGHLVEEEDTDGVHQLAILVEVIGATARDERRDRIEKRLEYAQFGVRWYWLVDPALGSVEILQLEDDGHYKLVATATAGVLEPVPGCDGLRLDVDALWADLARLAPDEP